MHIRKKKSSKVKMKNSITFPHTFSHLEAQEISTFGSAVFTHALFIGNNSSPFRTYDDISFSSRGGSLMYMIPENPYMRHSASTTSQLYTG